MGGAEEKKKNKSFGDSWVYCTFIDFWVYFDDIRRRKRAIMI